MEEARNLEKHGSSSGGESLTDHQGVEKLSTGLLTLYKPELERVRKQLVEFTKKQETLLEQLEVENKNFQQVMETTELHDVDFSTLEKNFKLTRNSRQIATVKACHGKLTNIKREMGLIHERTARLRKRALRLQQSKQREALLRTHQREERLLHEQSLIAEPVRESNAAGSPGQPPVGSGGTSTSAPNNA